MISHIYFQENPSNGLRGVAITDGRTDERTVSKRGITERKKAKIENPCLNAHLHININSHIYFQDNPSRGLGGVAITNVY